MILLDAVYDSFTFRGNYTWTINGPLSGNLVAGLYVGLRTVMAMVIIDGLIYPTIELTKGGVSERYDVDFLPLEIYDTDTGINIAENRNYSAGMIPQNRFGWWIETSYERQKYDLFAFDDADFIQGFITICNAFDEDFRNYIFGPPFKYNYDTREITYYNIQGYDIEPIPVRRIPAPIGPFYVDRDETDPNAEDYI